MISAMRPIMVIVSDIRSGEHIGVSPLTGRKVKPINISFVCDHLLHCNYLTTFNNFDILAQVFI